MAGEKGASFVLRLIDMVSGPLAKITKGADVIMSKFEGAAGTLSKFGKTALFLTSLNTAIQGTADAFNTAVAPGTAYETQLADLSAITKVTGKALDEIGDKARVTAKQFGGDAAAQIESYKVILSRLGPEIAQSPKALDNMGKSVQLLSKTMQGDALGAVDALTTAFNQYNVSLEDPVEASKSMSRMMDIMTASAQVGAAEVPDIAASLKVAGLAAKNAGLSFEEANAAIQVLAKGSIVGAEAGTALRNVLAIMSRGEFMPKAAAEALEAAGVNIKKLGDNSLTMAERLNELKKIQGDTALVSKVFGMENQNAATQLLQNIDLLEDWTGKVAVSGTTMEMASVVMNTHEERMKRITAAFKDFGIGVFNATKDFLPFIQTSVMMLAYSSQLVPGITLLSTAFTGLIGRLKLATVSTFGFLQGLVMTGAASLATAGRIALTGLAAAGTFVTGIISSTAAMVGLNIAMWANPIGLIIAGFVAVAATIGGAIYLIMEYWTEISDFMVGVFDFIGKLNPFYWLVELIDIVFPGFKQAVADFFNQIWEWVKGFWQDIVDIWNKVMDFFGDEVKSIDMEVGQSITYNTTENKNTTATSGLNQINSAGKRETNVQGDASRSRIVNLRIDQIKVEVKVNGPGDESGFRSLGEKITSFVVGAARDSETILSNA